MRARLESRLPDDVISAIERAPRGVPDYRRFGNIIDFDAAGQ